MYEKVRALYETYGLCAGSVEHIGYCEKWTVVDAGAEQSGMAFNFSGAHAVHGTPEPQRLAALQPYIGQSLFKLAQDLLETDHLMLRSCCHAALIALCQPLNAPDRLRSRGFVLGAQEDYAFIQPGDKVAVVGYGRVVGPLLERGIAYDVCDMRSSDALGYWSVSASGVLHGPPGVIFHGADETAAVLSQADVVFITGCTLINGTLDALIAQAAKARVIALFGPSAGVLPEFLFDRGVHYILSSRFVGGGRLFDTLLRGDPGAFDRQLQSYIVEHFKPTAF